MRTQKNHKPASLLTAILIAFAGVAPAYPLTAFGTVRGSAPPAALCARPSTCNIHYIPQSDRRRRLYDNKILKASNKYGIPPAFLKAQIHAETSFLSPSMENRQERRRYLSKRDKLPPFMREYKWGKGLGQFGANNAHLYGLAWQAADVGKTVTIQVMGVAQTVELRDVFDAQAAINAKAMFLRELIDGNFMFSTPHPVSGKTVWVHAFSGLQNPADYYRMLAAAYNHGPYGVANAVRSFFRKFGRLNNNFVELLQHTALGARDITRCHVARIAGLCDDTSGYMAIYEQDFEYNSRTGQYEIP